MRLWSLHPKYLDSRGLVALWREGLLALMVLKGSTKGYRNHPQLIRFRSYPDPPACLSAYLTVVLREAESRGYHFNEDKITPTKLSKVIPVSDEQVAYEWRHLKKKLDKREKTRLIELEKITTIECNPVFTVYKGPVEEWEKRSK